MNFNYGWHSAVLNTWTEKPSASRLHQPYTFLFMLPDGRVFDAGPDTGPAASMILNLATWTWGQQVGNPFVQAGMVHGSAAMYLPGKVIKCGGLDPGLATTAMIDFTQGIPAWSVVGPLNYARRNHNLVILPDGKVLCVGGNLNLDNPIGNYTPRLEAEIFDPATLTWTATGVQMTDPRVYHSTAILLRDARVLVAGGELSPPGGAYPVNSAQIYRPPYFDLDVVAPIIQTSPTLMKYGQSYLVTYTPASVPIAKACLIRLGSVTHGFDQDQRYVPLTLSTTALPKGTIQITAPANGNIAPPGYYMLFILEPSGKPCELAAYVQVLP